MDENFIRIFAVFTPESRSYFELLDKTRLNLILYEDLVPLYHEIENTSSDILHNTLIFLPASSMTLLSDIQKLHGYKKSLQLIIYAQKKLNIKWILTLTQQGIDDYFELPCDIKDWGEEFKKRIFYAQKRLYDLSKKMDLADFNDEVPLSSNWEAELLEKTQKKRLEILKNIKEKNKKSHSFDEQKKINNLQELLTQISKETNFTPPPFKKPLVLAVDDEKTFNDQLVLMLEDDFNVLQAYDGFDAFFILKDHPIDVVLLDIMLPHYDEMPLSDGRGTTLLPYLRKFSPFTEFIMLTAYDDPELRRISFQNGAFDYIIKNSSFNRDLFISKILNAAKRRYYQEYIQEVLNEYKK